MGQQVDETKESAKNWAQEKTQPSMGEQMEQKGHEVNRRRSW